MADPTQHLPRLLKASDLAQQTGISVPRIYELARTGQLPCIRLGRSMRFDPLAVRAWLEAGGTCNGTGQGEGV